MMSKSFQLLSIGVVCSILFSSMAAAKTPLRKATVAQTENATATTTQTPNITGTWKVSLSEEGRAATYIFTQKGNVLTGTMKGLPFGDMPISGTIANDGKLSFSGKMKNMKFSFAGMLTGQTMKGTADLPIGRKNWTATK
jgi:hypothetical protein